MTNSRQLGSAGLVGSRRTVNGKGVVRVEDRFETHIDDLWSALTDPRRLARWIVDVDGDLRLGGTFRARFTSGWDGVGRVDDCRSPRRLLLTMSPGQDDETVIEAQLSTDGDGTRLIIEERDLPLDELAAHGAGWHVHVEDLGAHIAGAEPADWRRRWIQLTPAYEDLATGPSVTDLAEQATFMT